jgi:hypothetical protein
MMRRWEVFTYRQEHGMFVKEETIEAEELRFEGGAAVFYRNGVVSRAFGPSGYGQIKLS